MKILLASHSFSPSIGGIETCSLMLATEFQCLGHEVRILTRTHSDESGDDCGLTVVRNPRFSELLSLFRWCDVFYQNNISLKTAWPLMFVRRPWFVTTATWLGKSESNLGPVGKIKRWLLRFSTNIYISDAVSKHVGHKGRVLGNPYDDAIFRHCPEVTRDRDIVFLGRLVSDKGCDMLLDALAKLRSFGELPCATIVGDGPDRRFLEAKSVALGINDQICFTGKMSGERLAKELNRHKIIVIPSRWNEPFGIVALEAMACGCFPIVSDGGGLPEATGGHGIVFSNNDLSMFVNAIRTAMNTMDCGANDFSSHLCKYKAAEVATRYLNEFQTGMAIK